jgi:hypothetical protein
MLAFHESSDLSKIISVCAYFHSIVLQTFLRPQYQTLIHVFVPFQKVGTGTDSVPSSYVPVYYR